VEMSEPGLRARRSLAVLLVLGTAGTVVAQARATVVYTDSTTPAVIATRDDGSRPVAVGTGRQPVVSPDGRLVAFATHEGLAVAPADGTAPPTILLAEARTVPLAFSPDGAAVVGRRTSRAGRASSTFVVSLSGGRAVALTSRPAVLVGFGDRGTVTLSERYRAGRNGSRVVVFRLADGARLRTLAKRVNGGGALSMAGRLAFGRSTATGRSAVFATRPFDRLLTVRREDEPTLLLQPVGWTPSARRLVIGVVGVGSDQTDVAVLGVRTRRVRVVARNVDRLVRLSRDGRTVLVERRDPVPRILSVPLNGRRAQVLARGAAEADWSR